MNEQVTSIENCDFSKLSIQTPEGLQGGTYLTKLLMNGSPLYIQCPTCYTKQGIINNGKKLSTDLLLTLENQSFIEWFETIEEQCYKLLIEKNNDWFSDELTESDIEDAFISPIKTYKSGKNYMIKCGIEYSKYNNNKPACVIYSESQSVLTPEDVLPSLKIIPLLHINGIKFTSKSFQFDIVVKQIMIVNEEPKSCLIQNNNAQLVNTDNIDKSDEAVSNSLGESKDDKITPPNKLDEVNVSITDEGRFHIKEKSQVYYQIYKIAQDKIKKKQRIELEEYFKQRKIQTRDILLDLYESDDEYLLDSDISESGSDETE